MALVFVALLVGLGCTTTAEPDIQGTVEAAVAAALYVRERSGLGQRIEGELPETARCLVVEDTTTTGGSVLEVIAVVRAHGAQVEALGGGYLDAPVSGGTRGAQAGTLSIMAGGSDETFVRAAAVFQPLGTVTHIGPVGSGQLAKLANQAIVGITIGAVSEALLLAAKGGARPEKVREALLGGFAGSKILEQHGERMLQRDFAPGAPARIQLKDLRMILDEARSEGLTLPLSQRVFEQYRALLASGNGEVDHSGLLLELERLNGVRLGSADEES